MIVVPGTNYEQQAHAIARLLGFRVARVHRKVFPDGEHYVRIEGVNRGDVAIVANTLYPRQNDSLVETLLLAEACSEAGSTKVVGLIPYMAYARQDKVFLEGEPVSLRAVLRAMRSSGIELLITVDAHSRALLDIWGKDVVNVQVSDLLVKRVLEEAPDPVVVAPDRGAVERARHAANAHGLTQVVLSKTRDRFSGDIVVGGEVDVNGRDVVIVDDIISTGGTIAEASKLLRSRGARRVFVAAAHGLFVGNALEKLKHAGVSRVLVANTVGIRVEDELVEYVDVTPRLAELLSKL
ncbi:MAG: ribose-phosphate diphosphokinase [Desulfurococcaceae archaeon]